MSQVYSLLVFLLSSKSVQVTFVSSLTPSDMYVHSHHQELNDIDQHKVPSECSQTCQTWQATTRVCKGQ